MAPNIEYTLPIANEIQNLEKPKKAKNLVYRQNGGNTTSDSGFHFIFVFPSPALVENVTISKIFNWHFFEIFVVKVYKL